MTPEVTLIGLLQASPGVFVAVAFVLGLLVGSFLNVVIHRLPLMMERDWRRQCAELAAAGPEKGSGTVSEYVTAAPAMPAADDMSRSGDVAAAGGLPAAEDVALGPEAGVVESSAPPVPEIPAPDATQTLAPKAPEELREEPFNLVVPRSACPACKAPIHAWQNIPIVSYVLLRGRCASCGTRISIRYPLIELLCGVLSAAVAWRYGFGWEVFAALIFTWCLIALSGIDLEHQLLPDSITLPLMWLGLLVSLSFNTAFAYDIGDPPLAFPVDPRSSIIGAAAGYLSLWSVYHLFKLVTGKEGMGYGDFKLFAAFGAWFGWKMLMLIILLAASTGAIAGISLMLARRHGRDVPIPFGPYLAAAGWVALLWGPQLVATYFSLWP